MADLTGRIALVTGASRGLGAATARALAAMGAKVILTDLTAPVELANELGGFAKAQDVTAEQHWIDTMAFARNEAGGLDILVNNAGLFLMAPVTQTSLEDWRRINAVNVEGVFLGCKHAIPLLSERAGKWAGGASIVNVSSVAGLRGTAGVSCYSASKGAVRLFTKGVALEVAPMKIRVNSVHPGIIETDMGADLVQQFSAASGTGDNEMRDALSLRHPLGHFGVPSNVADAVAFLASDKAAFITGSELVVDGGMSAQ
jgi:NAD(P)-dependent dehydrogenase (short-subunit alcohol dehydrogenase family)